MPLLSVNNRLIMSLIVVIVVLSLIAGVLVGLRFQALITAQTDTQSYCTGWDGSVGGGGGFPDVPTDSTKAGEIFDSSGFYYSWSNVGTSESVALQGAFRIHCRGNIFTSQALNPRYHMFINTGAGFVEMRQDDFPEGVIQLSGRYGTEGGWDVIPARTVHIDGTTFETPGGGTKGIVDGSILRVDLEFTDSTVGGVHVGARDEAVLRSAIPKLQRGAAQYEVGEEGSFSWQIPFVTVDGNTAYYLSITDENTGNPVGGWSRTPLSTVSGVARFPVTGDLFSTAPGARNAVRARLFSEVFQADVTEVSVIDNADLAPHINSVTLNQREFREGDTVRVHIDASPNPSTGFSVVRYHVLGHIGGDIVYDQDSASPDISFIASRTGVLAIEAIVYDTANRPSPVYEVQATVGNVIVECEVYPDLPQCSGRQLVPLILAVIIAVVAFIGAITLSAMAPARFRLPIFIGSVVIVALVLVATGVFESIGAALGG